jgi:Flp pilus assembly protein TadD
MFETITITAELAEKHNRLFQEAMAIVQNQIPLHGKTDMPVPGVVLSRQLRKAISLFRRALEINPNNWSAMWFIGKVHQRFREDKDALEWFKQSYDVNPSQTDIAREASLCAMQIGNHDMAIVFAHRAIQVDPTNPGLGANLALAYLLAGRIRDAQASISQAFPRGDRRLRAD